MRKSLAGFLVTTMLFNEGLLTRRLDESERTELLFDDCAEGGGLLEISAAEVKTLKSASVPKASC